MKTKYLLPFALGALMAVSCNKAEIDTPSEPVNNGDQLMELKAEIINTKTTYDDAGKFSWLSADKITVVVYNDGSDDASKLNTFDHYTFNNSTGDGTSATFTGSAITSPWNEYGVALYPNVNVSSVNCLKEGGKKDDPGFQVIVQQEIHPDLDNPLGVVPLIGRKNAQGVYQFKTAMGILKVTVSNIPADAYYLYLQDPSATFPFSGTFAVGDQDEIRAQDAVLPADSDFKKTIAFTPQAGGETRTFYIPVPTGTIPAGTQLKLDKGYPSYENIMTKTFAKDVTIEAGHVKPITAVAALPAADVLGTYTMAVTAGSYSSNNKAGLLVIEESDDPSKGSYMITKFADIAGKQYGYYDGTQLVFPENQLFAANPYSNATDYPYVALDAYTDGVGVTPAKFDILDSPRRIQYVGEQIGFRATTDDLWYNQSHNGAWPWSLAFASLVATRVTPVPLTASMITPIATEPSEGSVAGLVDGDVSTYWHSPYSVAGTYDSTYGIYLDIDLGAGNGVKDFQLRFCLRNSYNDHPNHVKIYASTDGSTWESVGELSDIYSTYGYGNWIDFVTCNATAKSRYIRISVLESYGSNATAINLTQYGCTHMAELELYSLD